MKKILIKLWGKAIPILLSFALLLTAILSVDAIKNLQGNARVINYTGIVRGATQRLIKNELSQLPDDTLIARLDEILTGLVEGNKQLRLRKLPSPEYQALLTKMKEKWRVSTK